MKIKFAIIWGYILFLPALNWAQNCCAPAVPQQGVLGEMIALPHTLEIGLHYEILQSGKMYEGSRAISDPSNTKADWRRATLTAAYGIIRQLGVSAIIPYAWKNKSRDLPSTGLHYENNTNGIGDITLLVRFSPLTRSFVNFRELSLGLGAKLPTGSVNERNFGFLLPEELQPGTGSWDYNGSLSYYQGFERVDFVLSGIYQLTTSHSGYKFGHQFSYTLASNFHLKSYLDLSASLIGLQRGRDRKDGVEIHSTGRHQLWFVPGVKVQILPDMLGLQAYYEHPLYQQFNGVQLGSEHNTRLSIVYTLPLSKPENKQISGEYF